MDDDQEDDEDDDDTASTFVFSLHLLSELDLAWFILNFSIFVNLFKKLIFHFE